MANSHHSLNLGFIGSEQFWARELYDTEENILVELTTKVCLQRVILRTRETVLPLERG
jgi:hypothetical protein